MLTTLLLLLLPTVSSFLTPPLLPTHPKSSLFGIPRKFAKYQGLGNDFICIDARDKTLPTLTDTFSASICDRNFGIGGDGVIFALASPDPAKYDFAMRIYNSDGSEPEMCGNGIRCLAKFLGQLDGKLAEGATYRIHTGAGLIVPVINKDGSVTVQMGKPILEAGDVPCTIQANGDSNSVVEGELIAEDDSVWKVNAVSMGNPHAIFFVDKLDDLDFEKYGPMMERHKAFPAKVNAEFVEVVDDNHLRMKVWERGAGPTLACGTGACALTVAAVRAGKIPRAGEGGTRVTLPGGDLFIEWRESDGNVYMKGPAELVFEGVVESP